MNGQLLPDEDDDGDETDDSFEPEIVKVDDLPRISSVIFRLLLFSQSISVMNIKLRLNLILNRIVKKVNLHLNLFSIFLSFSSSY